MLTRSTYAASIVLSSAVLLAATAVSAQPRPQPAQPAPAQPAPAQPAAPSPAQPPPSDQPPVEETTATAAKFDIKDPLLGPVPPAARTLTGWRDALSLISARSTELRVASLEVERARGVSREALGRALPQIVATGSATYDLLNRGETSTTTETGGTIDSTSSSNGWDLRAALTVSQPVLAPRVWHAVGTADRAVHAAKLTVDDRRRTIVATVADAIVVVVTAERVSEINRVGLRSALERLDLFQRKLKLGSGTLLDIVRAEQDATLARATLISGDEALLQAREGLGLALGSSEGYGVPTTISLNDIESSARATCSPATPDGRADVLAAKAQLEISERAVTDVKLGYLPTAEVSTTFAASSTSSSSSPLAASIPLEGDSTFDRKEYSWSIQGVISIPIWDGGSRYGAMRTARAEVEQQKERVEAARRGATLESNQALRLIQVADQRRLLAEKNRDLASKNAALTQKAFESGASTSFELVEAARRLREAELDLAVREFDLVKAKIAALLANANCAY